MTLQTTAVRTTVLGNGAQTVFNYSFIIPAQSMAELYYLAADGTQTLVPASQWLLNSANNPAGGTFQYPFPSGAALPTGASLTLIRTVPYTQSTALANQTNYYPASVEAALDRLDMQIQQLNERLARALLYPATDSPTNTTLPDSSLQPSTILGFDATGVPAFLSAVPIGGALITAFGEQLIEQSTAAGARDLLGVNIDGWRGTAGGTANAITIATVPATVAYTAGETDTFIVATTNTGAVTINKNGLGAKTVKTNTGAALVSGQMRAGTIVTARYDGTDYILTTMATGRLLAVQRFTANGTYTPTPGATMAIVEAVGGGGAGGGVGATGVGFAASGGGGGAGAYGKLFVASGLASQTVTIAAAVAGSTGNGANGNTTSFGALLSCAGGGGGTSGVGANTASITSSGGVGGAAPSGTLVVSLAGEAGTPGYNLSATSSYSGRGGASTLGQSGNGVGVNATIVLSGNTATGFGSGGGGAVAINSGVAALGGNGAPGIIIVWEYA